MSLSAREKVLTAVTVCVLLFGVVLMQLRARIELIRDCSKATSTLKDRIELQRELIGASDIWAERYEGMKQQMPVFDRTTQVDTYWLNIMDLAAEQSGVTIRNRSAKKETEVSDVFEFPIEVREWEATLESFVKFVYAMQSEGAMLDMREMRVSPLPNRPGYLKGSFVLYCAYMRGDVATVPTTPNGSAEAKAPQNATEGVSVTNVAPTQVEQESVK